MPLSNKSCPCPISHALVQYIMPAFPIFFACHDLSPTLPERLSLLGLLQARRLIVNAVLATDMTQHMRLLDAFSQGYAEQPDLANWRDTDVLLQLVLHTADLCNPCRQIEFSIRWGELICKEFLEQVSQCQLGVFTAIATATNAFTNLYLHTPAMNVPVAWLIHSAGDPESSYSR